MVSFCGPLAAVVIGIATREPSGRNREKLAQKRGRTTRSGQVSVSFGAFLRAQGNVIVQFLAVCLRFASHGQQRLDRCTASFLRIVRALLCAAKNTFLLAGRARCAALAGKQRAPALLSGSALSDAQIPTGYNGWQHTGPTCAADDYTPYALRQPSRHKCIANSKCAARTNGRQCIG